MAEPQADLHTYRGSCHCGNFIFEAQLPEIKAAYECNCSICSRKAYLWQFPGEGGFKVLKGDPNTTLTTYKFLTQKYQHKFCSNCGIPVMAVNETAKPGRDIGVNVRTLQGLSSQSFETHGVNGAAITPAYEPPTFTGTELTAEVEGGKVYHGSCHCGAVKMALKSKPLDETYDQRVISGDCSICSRGGYIWIYPAVGTFAIEGRDNLSYYVFGSRTSRKAFCKHCGVLIFNEGNPELTEEEIAALSETEKARHKRLSEVYNGVNARIFNDADWKTLKPTQANCKAAGKEYVEP